MVTFNNYLDQIQADYSYVVSALHMLKRGQKKERKKLIETIQKLKYLKSCLQAAQYSQQPSLSLGLPELSFATREQKQVCITYLEHRLQVANQIQRQVEKLTLFIQSLAQGEGYDFWLKFRLPSIRKLLKKIFSLQTLTATLEQRNRCINNELASTSRLQYHDITDLRNQIEKLCHRKLKLKQWITKEKEEITQFQNIEHATPKMASDPWIIEQFQRKITESDPYFPVEQRIATLKKLLSNSPKDLQQ